MPENSTAESASQVSKVAHSMIFQVVPWLLVAGFFACCGCAVASLVLDRKYKRAQRRLEREMTHKVKERIDAYVVLERQVRRVIEEFDRHESVFKELVSLQ